MSLSNADFRTLMMTPRPGVPPPNFKTPRGKSRDDEDEDEQIRKAVAKDQRDKKKNKNKKPGKNYQKNKEEEEESSKPKYRDRADERRKDANPDYLDDDLLAAISATDGEETAEDVQKKAIENSKYLGGDIAHTHLVKGLDFALLNRIRTEIAQKEKEEQVKQQQTKQLEDAGRLPSKPAMPAPVATPLPQKLAAAEPTPDKKEYGPKTPLGKAIDALLMAPPPPKSVDLFLPRRMTFVYDMEFGEIIPTTILRSKDDCPKEDQQITAKVNDEVLDKITKIMGYLRQGVPKPKKQKKKETTEVAPTKDETQEEEQPKPAAPQPKIFEDAEDYMETESPKSEQPTQELGSFGKLPEGPAMPDFEFEDAGYPEADEIDQQPPPQSQPQPQPQPQPSLPPQPQQMPPAEAPYNQVFIDPVQQQYYAQLQMQQQMQAAPFMGPVWPGYEYQQQAQAQYPVAPPMPYMPVQQPIYPVVQQQQQPIFPPETQDQNVQKEPTQAEKDKGMLSVFRRDDEKLRTRKETDKRERDPTFVSDSYSECYPGSFESSYFAYDSDEEDDVSKLDTGGKKRLHRKDFASEEAWAEYNQKMEAMPKAAFQFGVKMTGGRKSKKQKDSKFNKELTKLNSVIKKKEGERKAAMQSAGVPLEEGDGGGGGGGHHDGGKPNRSARRKAMAAEGSIKRSKT